MNIRHWILPAAAASSLLAAGCGNDGGGTATPANSTVAQPAVQGTSATQPPTTPAAASAPGTVDVQLDEWGVKPSTPTASAGKVTFKVTNSGKVPHEMVVVRTDKPAGGLGTGSRVSEKGSAGETGDVAPGASKTATLKLAKGHYALICNIPGHYSSGMHADFTVN